jgi:hypothetical protein
MAARFRIHPAIGIARLGNIPDKFYIAADQGGQLPIQCDDAGYPIIDKDGHEVRVTRFKDEAGRIMRQAARFRVFVYDDRSPDGREVSIGDEFDIVAPRTGQLLIVRIDDIKWTVYLANKKSSWYKFEETNGEHGYDSDHPDHPLRNAHVTNTEERQRLIIDPGPRSVRYKNEAAQRARFDGQGGVTSFPPELAPNSIHTLGELRCTQSANINRLLVLGGFGNSGSMLDGFGNPKIEAYANNDGWFDDTADNNPLSNTALAKFFRLTDTMLFMLRQWAAGLFIDEQAEGIDPGLLPPGRGNALDRVALAAGLGGSFCAGAEASWIMRNPAIYSAPYRFRHARATPGALPGDPPATTASLEAGLEPGDLTKYSAVP